MDTGGLTCHRLSARLRASCGCADVAPRRWLKGKLSQTRLSEDFIFWSTGGPGEAWLAAQICTGQWTEETSGPRPGVCHLEFISSRSRDSRSRCTFRALRTSCQ